MLSQEQKDHFISLKVEIIDLNILSHLFIRKMNRFTYLFQNTSRHHIFEELVALRYMENGIILHLTNLDDDSSKFSFREAIKQINKTFKDQKKKDKLNESLKLYRRNLGKLKNNHRNKRIAHLNYSEDLELDQFMNFEKDLNELIIQANSIADIIWGEKINYYFKLGNQDETLDIRKLTENLKFNVNNEKGF